MKDSPNLLRRLDHHRLKKTSFRRELLRVFEEADAPLSAAQVFERMVKSKRQRAYRFDRATLFRNLKTMLEKNILNASEFGTGATYYCLNFHSHHHHHVFCVRCQSVLPLETCAIQPMIDQALLMGYQVLDHRLELLGVCPKCKDA